MSCEINFKETAVQSRSQIPNSGNHPACGPSPQWDSRHSCCVRLFEHRFSRGSYPSCVSQHFSMKAFVLIGQSTKFWQLVCSGAILSCPDLSSVVDLSSGDDWPTAHSQHSALVQCSWLCALWWVSCSDKYNHDHPVAPLLQPFGTWRSPHNNSALTGQLSQGWRGSLVLRVSFCGLKELLAGLKRLSSKDRRWWGDGRWVARLGIIGPQPVNIRSKGWPSISEMKVPPREVKPHQKSP